MLKFCYITGPRYSYILVPCLLGLDPADPYFQYTDPEVRLDPTDATFVDILHTDGASIRKLGKWL